MDRYQELSKNIMQIYRNLSGEIGHFVTGSGLTCVPGCGKCCFDTQVSASVLEMIPTALAIFKNGEAENILLNLENKLESHCVFYEMHTQDGQKGRCQNYEYRPTVCRSFGAMAMRGKDGEKKISACRPIKEAHKAVLEQVKSQDIPLVDKFTIQLMLLDNQLGQKLMPINQALQLALQNVMTYYQYQQGDDFIDCV